MKRWFLILLLIAGLVGFSTSRAQAHGSAGQETFIRLQTMASWDLKVEPTTVKVGEEFTMTGKFKVLETWPTDVLGPLHSAYLTLSEPARFAIHKAAWINGEFAPGAFYPKAGQIYEFKIVGVARNVGLWPGGKAHMHPKMNFYYAGPLLGPGAWLDIQPGTAPFTNPVTLMNGQTVDLETYGFGRVVGWHLITIIPALAWIVYWLILKPILARAPLVASGLNLITRRDTRVSVIFAIVTGLILWFGYTTTKASYPEHIPLQINRITPPRLPDEPRLAEVTPQKVVYNRKTRTLTMDVRVTNVSDKRLELQQMVFAYLDFKNKGLEPNAEHLMVVEPSGPIQPKETKALKLTFTDPAWETERLELLPIQEVQTIIACLSEFVDTEGRRQHITIQARVLPERI